jgi:hypothetical protein
MMLSFLVWGFSALMIGAAIGPLQALNYGGINAYPYLQPLLQTYYQGLTIHGVLNAYIFTFFVACGLLVYLPACELGLPPNMSLWRLCFGLMAAGTLMLLYAMFDNSSSVLWTFYPPLKGSVFFYLGMTLVVLGSLLPLPIVLDLRARWKTLRPPVGLTGSPEAVAATARAWGVTWRPAKGGGLYRSHLPRGCGRSRWQRAATLRLLATRRPGSGRARH